MATADKKSATQNTPEKKGSDAASNPSMPNVAWNDANMQTAYANVVNVVSSREEMTLFFGTNQSWNANDKEFTVDLSDRIILNPHAAKRLLTLLGAVVQEYENRYGKLNIDPGQRKPDELR